jgi:hypothetical protein
VVETTKTEMKQLISEWVLAIEAEPSNQTTLSCPASSRRYSAARLLSDESKVLLLAHLYLELRLTAEQALRAARADIVMATTAQTRRLWEERRR